MKIERTVTVTEFTLRLSPTELLVIRNALRVLLHREDHDCLAVELYSQLGDQLVDLK